MINKLKIKHCYGISVSLLIWKLKIFMTTYNCKTFEVYNNQDLKYSYVLPNNRYRIRKVISVRPSLQKFVQFRACSWSFKLRIIQEFECSSCSLAIDPLLRSCSFESFALYTSRISHSSTVSLIGIQFGTGSRLQPSWYVNRTLIVLTNIILTVTVCI